MIESTLFQYPDNVHQTKDRTRTQVLFDGRQCIIVCQSTNIRFKYCHFEGVILDYILIVEFPDSQLHVCLPIGFC